MRKLNSTTTIRDVAAAAGVSVSTVSRVLNNKDDVAPETTALVRRIIDDMGYASSLAAKSLRSRRTNVVGMIVPEMWHPFTALVIKGANQEATECGYDLLAYASASRNINALASWEQQHVALLNGSVTDGIILVVPNARTYKTAYPLVAVDPHSQTTDFPSVISTNHRGIVDVMTYLIGLGHRQIGYIGGRIELQSAQRRFEGYKESLAAAGIAYDPTLVEIADYTKPTAMVCARRLLSRAPRPSAIVAASDETAFGVYEVVAEFGLRIPEDLSVVGFDNVTEAASVDPPLTTVDQSIEEMGRVAVRMVVDQIEGRPLATMVQKVPTHLVIRESCRALAT